MENDNLTGGGDVFTLEDAGRDVGGTIFSTIAAVIITFFKTIWKIIVAIVRTILYLLLLIPQLIQLIIFGLFLFILSKMWGVFKGIFQILFTIINGLIPAPLVAWNVIAMIFNTVGMLLSLFGLSLPKLPTVDNPDKWKLPTHMPTAIEFATWVLSPVAKSVQKSAHSFVYS